MTSPHAMARAGAATVTGVRSDGIERFSAIRYARPPIGDLRFAAPVPLPLAGDVDATRPGPIAPQMPSRLREVMGDFDLPQSEDCLHLTVWTPAADGARRPVLVWLHGGAWQSGAGALDWYDGARLARAGGMVVVGVNYRLAALGWLCADGIPANLGLLDQELALQWVARHIAAFGGDPDAVTVMGQSAGGTSVAALLARRPSFRRAIMQSAPLGRGFRSAEDAALLGRAVLRAAGASDLETARRLPVRQLLLAQQAPQVQEALRAQPGTLSLFSPVRDGETLPLDMAPALKRAAGLADVLIGYTANEMAAFPGGAVDPDNDRLGDRVFGAMSRQWAADALAAGRAAWVYRVDVAPTRRFGACHCIELPFVFGTLQAFAAAPMLQGLPAADGERLARDMQRAWTAFARGEPMPWASGGPAHVFR